jgi:hypothetical protein
MKLLAEMSVRDLNRISVRNVKKQGIVGDKSGCYAELKEEQRFDLFRRELHS